MLNPVCQRCNKRSAILRGHWVHEGAVYSEYNCTECYGEYRGFKSDKDRERLEGAQEEKPTRKRRTPKQQIEPLVMDEPIVTPTPTAVEEKPVASLPIPTALWSPSLPVRNRP